MILKCEFKNFQFCGSKATDKDDEIRLLTRSDRISAAEFSEVRKPNHILVDVRTEPEMKICAIENSLNIPMQEDSNVRIRDIVGGLHAWANTVDPTFPVYWRVVLFWKVLCQVT